MATPNRISLNRTPRRSSVNDINQRDTPHSAVSLHLYIAHSVLAYSTDILIRKLRRPSDATTTPTTPGQALRDFSLSARRQSIRRTPRGSGAPTTPHALRAIQRRAAVFTPGRDRRKSGRIQRETPIDILKNLGRGMEIFTLLLRNFSVGFIVMMMLIITISEFSIGSCFAAY